MFSGNHIRLSTEHTKDWEITHGRLSGCSIFCLLMLKAFLTHHFESISRAWPFIGILISSWTWTKRKESSNVCHLQEFTFYWILSTSSLLFIRLSSYILKIHFFHGSLPLSQQKRGGEPTSLEKNWIKDTMFHLYDKCKFYTKGQIPYFKWWIQVVLKHRILTDQVQGTENTEFQRSLGNWKECHPRIFAFWVTA